MFTPRTLYHSVGLHRTWLAWYCKCSACQLKGSVCGEKSCCWRQLLELKSSLPEKSKPFFFGGGGGGGGGASLSEPHQTSGWPSSLAAILDVVGTFNFWSPLISVDQPARSAFALCTASLHGRLHASSVPACYFTSFRVPCDGLRMHAGLSRPTHIHVGQLAWAGLDHARARGRPRWHALFKEPRPVMYMQRCLHGDPDMFMYMKLGL